MFSCLLPADKQAEQTWHFRVRSCLYVDLNTFEPSGDFLSFSRSQTATPAGVRWLACANMALQFTVWDIPGERGAPSGLLVARLSLCSCFWQVVTSEWRGGWVVITGPPALHFSTLYAAMHRFPSSVFSPKRFASALGSGLYVCGCSFFSRTPLPLQSSLWAFLCVYSVHFWLPHWGEAAVVWARVSLCPMVWVWCFRKMIDWLIDFCRRLKPIHGIF